MANTAQADDPDSQGYQRGQQEQMVACYGDGDLGQYLLVVPAFWTALESKAFWRSLQGP